MHSMCIDGRKSVHRLHEPPHSVALALTFVAIHTHCIIYMHAFAAHNTRHKARPTHCQVVVHRPLRHPTVFAHSRAPFSLYELLGGDTHTDTQRDRQNGLFERRAHIYMVDKTFVWMWKISEIFRVEIYACSPCPLIRVSNQKCVFVYKAATHVACDSESRAVHLYTHTFT